MHFWFCSQSQSLIQNNKNRTLNFPFRGKQKEPSTCPVSKPFAFLRFCFYEYRMGPRSM